MRIGVRTSNGDERRLIQAEQLGAHGGSIWARALPGFRESFVPTLDGLLRMRERFEAHNLMLTGIGLGGDALKNQLLGLPQRDRDVENACETIRIIGKAYEDKPASESPVIIIDQRVTYWSKLAWRGMTRVAGRGGILFKDFDASRVADIVETPAGRPSFDQVWERIAYLYERIVPVAEEADIRLATHPDDPPLPVFLGAVHALNGGAGFKRLFEMFPSTHNGMLLCLGVMQEAGENVVDLIRYFGARKKIFYVHFRNVKGTVPHFIEVFPNMGDMDMVAAIKALRDVDYGGFLVPDHQFGIEGDDDWSIISRAWQIGYISALLQVVEP